MSEPLRIRHLASGDLWAGAEVQTCTLLSRLVEDRSLALEAVLFNEGRLARELRALGISTTVLDERRLGPWALYRALVTHFRAHPVDLLHTHKYKGNVLGSLAARRGGVSRVVRTMHGWPEPFAGLRASKMRLYQALDRWANRRWVDRVIAVSEQIRDGSTDIDARKIVCIHNGVDPATLQPIEAVDSAATGAEFVIGAVGRLTAVKGYEYLVSALPVLIDAHPRRRFRLLLVGEGPLAASLSALAQQLGVGDRVEFAGHLDDCRESLTRMDVVVFPSLSEGIPMALLEALALERPVVATRVGGMPEVIKDGENGLLVSERDPRALALACGRLLDEAGLARALGQAGRKTVCERFSAARNAARIVALYRELV